MIPKAPSYSLCQEIVSYLLLQQWLHWQRLAVECLQVVAEEQLVMNMAASTMGIAHTGQVTLMVSDLRLVDDVLNVKAGKPDRTTQEEQSVAWDAGGKGGDDGDKGDNVDGSGNDGGGNDEGGNDRDADGDRDENENEDGDGDRG
ncbi:hypothetical protein HOY80DRAFT_1047540 [Tuber brumale]|nr:hypothetical protein HOY80DRAFT_1047540 [Tuber brumale]